MRQGREVSEKVFFYSAFAVLLAGRLLVSGSGYLDDSDETPYIYVLRNFYDLIALDTQKWNDLIFHSVCQPPETAIRLFETSFALAYSSISGTPMEHFHTLYIMGLFNIAVSMLILFVFYRVLRKLEFASFIALSCTFALGALANMNIYTRHILPYETSLLFHLIALNILLNKELAYRQTIAAGLLSAIGLTNYFGHFMFVFIHAGALLHHHFQTPINVLKKSVVFSIPFAAILMLFEVFTRLNGQSYIIHLFGYSSNVLSGSFSEGLKYIFIYFNLAEGWWGLMLLLLFFAGILFVFRSGTNPQARVTLLLGIAAYLLYGGYVYFFEGMVFYGRVFHMYYPFIILGVACFVSQQKTALAKTLSLSIFAAALINYGFVIKDLNDIGYPKSMIYHNKLVEEEGKVRLSKASELYCEEMDFELGVKTSGLKPGEYLLLNFCFFDHSYDSVKTYKPYQSNPNNKIVIEKNHFMSHPVYTLEYCTSTTRDFFLEKKLKMKLIKTR